MNKRPSTKTLDIQHNLKMKTFQENQSSLTDKEDELAVVNEAINQLNKNALSNLSPNEFDKYMDLNDKKRELEHYIQLIKRNCDELDYYVDTADIVFKYYDIVENGNILENENSQIVTENSILKFFQNPSDSNTQNNINGEPSSAKSNSKKDDDRASLLEKYMGTIDDNYMCHSPHTEADYCPICESKNRTLLVNDGLMYCNDCYTIETIIIDHEKPSYKDPPKEISYFSYKRLMIRCLKCYIVLVGMHVASLRHSQIAGKS
jgi:hypothetical protein